jgi:nucleotidyltransferase/DNA polymerase involved in DNA repair
MASPSQTRRTLQINLQRLSTFTQWVEAEHHTTQSATLYADLGKLTIRDGQQIAEQINQIFDEHGFNISIGLASNKFVAYVAARVGHRGSISVCAERRGSCLSHIPFGHLLTIRYRNCRRLNLLGLHQIGQIAAIPRPALIEQFGKLGGRLHHLAGGEDTRKVAKYTAPVTKRAERQFDSPVENRLIIESVLAGMSAEIMRQLINQQMTCRDVLLILHLENHSEQEAGMIGREPISSSNALYRSVRATHGTFEYKLWQLLKRNCVLASLHLLYHGNFRSLINPKLRNCTRR